VPSSPESLAHDHHGTITVRGRASGDEVDQGGHQGRGQMLEGGLGPWGDGASRHQEGAVARQLLKLLERYDRPVVEVLRA
jgi:hypothetical protein